MTRSKVYNLRLSEEEWNRLKNYAESKEISPAEVLRDYVKRLPKTDGT
ncbi:MAG: DNA-binding protein [Microcystaceae cyanobacterium]